MRYRASLATALLSLTLLLAACASGPTIIANQDPGADFSAYKTYDFVSPLSTDRGGFQAVLSGFLIKATQDELNARGMRRAADPDLLIDFIASTQQKISASSQPAASVGMHGGRGGYGTWGGYSMAVSTTRVTQTTEGTVAIDVIDRKRQQLVWEAAATGRVKEETRENLQYVVPELVSELFARYPVPRSQ
ncbi:MAG: DUF4136 domain-containing protein [Gammaproteobacteria bacterium]|nr:DUF4136 domain-containing protein [Gammaproteobacteria bacterium]